MRAKSIAVAAVAFTIALVSQGADRAGACSFPVPQDALLAVDGDVVFYGEKLSERVWQEPGGQYGRQGEYRQKYLVVEATFRAMGHWKGPPDDVVRVRATVLMTGPCAGPIGWRFPERTMVIGKYVGGVAYISSFTWERSIHRWGIPARYPPFREWSVIPPAWEEVVNDDSWLDIHVKATGHDSIEDWHDNAFGGGLLRPGLGAEGQELREVLNE